MSKLPEFLVEKLVNQYGQDVANKIIDGYNEERFLSFRVNTLKSSIKEIEDVLKENSIFYERVDWFEEAFIIINKEKQEIQNLSIYEEGKIYLQSLSSMLPPLILDPKENTDILDMCAAPRR